MLAIYSTAIRIVGATKRQSSSVQRRNGLLAWKNKGYEDAH